MKVEFAVAARSDRELIDDIRAGRREALGALLDRYIPQLYEFTQLLTGDPAETPRLLEQVFTRIPASLEELGEHESVRGWLYTLCRGAGLGYLAERGWLTALPRAAEPAPAELGGVVWLAARAMPAFLRAVLIVEELHGLSPTEKARALNVARMDWQRLVDDARQAFNLQYDRLAAAEGRPLSAETTLEREQTASTASRTPARSLRTCQSSPGPRGSWRACATAC